MLEDLVKELAELDEFLAIMQDTFHSALAVYLEDLEALSWLANSMK